MTPRDSILTDLTDKQRKEYDRFEQFVLTRAVKPRDGKEGEVFVLDKRSAQLGKAGRETLRSPADPQWPERGTTTTSSEIAMAWAKSHYVPLLWQTRNAASVHPNATGLTVAQAFERYKEAHSKERRDGSGQLVKYIPGKIRSRVSMIERHVLPAFGPLIFASITRTMVREEAENLIVVHKELGGRRQRVSASEGTKNNFITALKALWDECFPDVTAPFAGVRVRPTPVDEDDDDLPSTVFDHATLTKQLREAEGKGALDSPDVRRLFIAAQRRDRDLMARKQTAGQMIPNTVHAIALLVATGCRICELLRLRWCDIEFEEGYIIIHQAKRKSSRRAKRKPKLRIVPLQEALRPWLEQLRELSGITDRKSLEFVIRTDPDEKLRNRPGAQTTISARVARALESAGLKVKGKATHWARSTYSTWGTGAEGVKAEELQHFLGHRAFSGSTDQYVAMLIGRLRDAHRKFIELPRPDDVAKELDGFRPITSDWRLRKRPKSRAKAAVEARRLAAAQDTLVGSR